VAGRHGDGWKVRVRSAPEKGRANQELVALVARALGVPPAAVAIERGHASRDKWLRVSGLAPDEVDRRLAEAAS
jgi:uncharacterized protein YggU (UPF0235/DUF167 family)